MAGAIDFLSDHQLVAPPAEDEQRALLLRLLRERSIPCVLDNFDTLLEPGQREPRYRAGYGGYGRLFHAVGDSAHQSCVTVRSCEAPPELAVLDGAAVRSVELGGPQTCGPS
jgi:hypothetical protein